MGQLFSVLLYLPTQKMEKNNLKKKFALCRLPQQSCNGFKEHDLITDKSKVSSSFCLPGELVSFVHPRDLVSFVHPKDLVSLDPLHITCSPPILKYISIGR